MSKNNKIEVKKSSIATISNEKFLSVYNLENCLQVYKNLNIVDQCLESKSPTLAAIKRDKSENFCIGFIQAWLVNLNEILNLNKPMTVTQINLCSVTVLNDYYFFKVADLTLMFKRIIAGEYGEFYERLSIPKVLTFFRQYSEERMNRAEEINTAFHQEQKIGDPMNISKNIKRIWNGTPSK